MPIINLQKTTEPELQNDGFLYGDLSYKINGILIEIFKELGPYAKEKQYSILLAKKFEKNGLKYQKEVVIGDTGNILDFIVDEKNNFRTKNCFFFK